MDETAYFIEQRSRLTFDRANFTYEVRVSFQDVRIWGESPQIGRKGENLKDHLANEVDLVYQLSLKKGVQFQLGYSFLRATDSMLELRNRNRKDNHWAWMMMSVSPRLKVGRK